jgi:aminocarboxymuconate-semialdehyde decarboxylase
MRIVDSHFHWWPKSVFEELKKRTDFPRARSNDKGGYDLLAAPGVERNGGWADWFDIEKQFEYLDSTGYDMDVVCSVGPINSFFSEIPADIGHHLAQMWNDEMAGVQNKYAGRVWASAMISMADPKLAIDELERAVTKLGLIGVNIPGSVGVSGRIDTPELEAFYTRVEQLGVPIFMHPTDAAFSDILDGYDGALYNSLGRVIDVSVSAYRLVLSGIMERHPNLKVFMSHTGGALPYQAGRMDKNSKAAKLPKPPSTYLKRFYTDTVSPHSLGVKFAVEFYGVDHVMYGSDYPCWDPKAALKVFEECGLSKADQEKIFSLNARRVLGLKMPEKAKKEAVVA